MGTLTPHSTDLQAILTDINVDITRVGDREITGRCPVHLRVVGHEDRSPSWSINISSGLWICFSCGARGTLSMLLNELAGADGESAQKFLISSGFKRLTTEDSGTDIPEPTVDFHTFSQFQIVSDRRCASKNLDPELVAKHGVRWDSQDKCWIIPIISPTGNLLGWQAKKSGWVRNRPSGVEKSTTLFGIERFRAPTAVVVESPLDVVRFAAVIKDAQCLSTFGAHVSLDQIRLLTHVCDQVIVAMDNDDAGWASAKRLYATMSPPRKGIKWWSYDGTTAKDIGEMTDEEIQLGYKNASVIPPWLSTLG